MKVSFDQFERMENPMLYACSPGSVYQDGLILPRRMSASELSSANNISNAPTILVDESDVELVLNFNAISELNFRVYRTNRDDPEMNALIYKQYKSLRNKRMIFIPDVGFFVIKNVTESFEDGMQYKDIQSESCEVELQDKTLTYIEDGTYNFTTLLEKIVAEVPLWTIGDVDSNVALLYRTFENVSTDSNVLNFMLSEMQDAYECIFVFDTINRVINVYDQNNYVVQTDIHITRDDVINALEIEESSDDLYTSISVMGDEDLSINAVNPLGTSTIYRFDYYLDWMSEELSAKVSAWQDAIKDMSEDYYQKNSEYYTKLAARSDLNLELNNLNQRLTQYTRCKENVVASASLEGINEYNELIVEYGGIEIETEGRGEADVILLINQRIAEAESDISTCEAAIAAVDTALESMQAEINAMRESVNISTYFTEAEYSELYNYISEGSYSDEYITVTDNMSYTEKFAQMKTLYDRAVKQLESISEPTQEFSVDSENFIFVKDFQRWTNQLETGCLINVELDMDDVAALFLSTITVNFEDKSLELTFGNRFNSFTPKALYEDVLGSVSKTANTLSYIKDLVYPIKSGEFNEMKEALETSRTLAKNSVLASNGETVLIDDTGYTGRRRNADGSFDPHQIKINGQNIVFTDDAWETCVTAIGKLILADGETAYGINAQILMGDVIVGNELHILDSSGSDMFSVTEDSIMTNVGNMISSETQNVVTELYGEDIANLKAAVVNNSTKLEQTNTNIQMTFSSLLEDVSNLTEETSSQFNTITSYIRFEGGKIILGERDSLVHLVIDNDQISFYNGTIAEENLLTYWTTESMYSPHALTIPSGGTFTLGDYKMAPRVGGGVAVTYIGE